MSPQIEELFGHPVEDWLADVQSLGAVVHPDDLPIVKRAEAEARERHEPFELEYRVFRADGSDPVRIFFTISMSRRAPSADGIGGESGRPSPASTSPDPRPPDRIQLSPVGGDGLSWTRSSGQRPGNQGATRVLGVHFGVGSRASVSRRRSARWPLPVHQAHQNDDERTDAVGHTWALDR